MAGWCGIWLTSKKGKFEFGVISKLPFGNDLNHVNFTEVIIKSSKLITVVFKCRCEYPSIVGKERIVMNQRGNREPVP